MTSYLKGVYLKLDQWKVGIYDNIQGLIKSELKAAEKNPNIQEDKLSKISPPMLVPLVRILSSEIHA